MAPRRDKPKRPRFPRRRWQPGQAPRVEDPEKGGDYDRARERRRARRDAEDPEDGPRPAP